MKKYGIIAMLLLVLTAVGIVAAHFVIDGQRDDVTITETTISGDKSHADGITIKAKFEDGRNTLNWWTTYSTTEDKVVDCETDMINDEWTQTPFVHLRLETLNYGVDDPEDTQMVAEIGEAKTSIPASEVLEKIEESERQNVAKYTFNLSDYMDYFPVWIGASLSDDGELFYDKMPSVAAGDDPLMLNYEYFQVPVPKGLKGTLKVIKDKDGKLKNWNMDVNDNQFEVESDGVFDGNCIYLATSGIGLIHEVIDFHAEVADHSAHLLDMPTETHGIHYIPLEGNGKSYRVDLEHAKCIYPLGPNEKILKLEKGHSGNELLLYTSIDEDIYLSIIDKVTMKRLQKTLLLKDGKQLYGVIQGENFVLSIDLYRNFVLMDTTGDTYEEKIRGNAGDLPYYLEACAADFDGERLAFSTCVRYDEDGADVKPHYTLQVFTDEGLVYSGTYEASLTMTDKHQGVVISHNGKPIEVSFDEMVN